MPYIPENATKTFWNLQILGEYTKNRFQTKLRLENSFLEQKLETRFF